MTTVEVFLSWALAAAVVIAGWLAYELRETRRNAPDERAWARECEGLRTANADLAERNADLAADNTRLRREAFDRQAAPQWPDRLTDDELERWRLIVARRNVPASGYPACEGLPRDGAA